MFDLSEGVPNPQLDRLKTLDVKGGRTSVFMFKGFKVREAVARYPESSREGQVEAAVVWIREPFKAPMIDGKLQQVVHQSLFFPEEAEGAYIDHLIDQTRRNVAFAFLKYWNEK